MTPSAYLSLENGIALEGKLLHEIAEPAFGEVVFTTGMTGYVETLTDPSYAGEIVCFTYPLIGNYGIPDPKKWESKKIFAKGVILSRLFEGHARHSESVTLFSEWLKDQGVPVLMDIDTRRLTKILRTKGTLKGCISSQKNAYSPFQKSHLPNLVSIEAPVLFGKGKKRIIAVDCGMKENIMRSFLDCGVEVLRVPYNFDYRKETYDGIFLSNGPGDPQDWKETIDILKTPLGESKPVFGICLGAQLMALAAQAKTYKLPFGHRGHNQPCRYIPTGACYMTSQNHGYAIDKMSLGSDWIITFENLNDGSIEGISHKQKPFSAVQFHPEAFPGPHDTFFLFREFVEKL